MFGLNGSSYYDVHTNLMIDTLQWLKLIIEHSVKIFKNMFEKPYNTEKKSFYVVRIKGIYVSNVSLFDECPMYNKQGAHGFWYDYFILFLMCV